MQSPRKFCAWGKCFTQLPQSKDFCSLYLEAEKIEILIIYIEISNPNINAEGFSDEKHSENFYFRQKSSKAHTPPELLDQGNVCLADFSQKGLIKFYSTVSQSLWVKAKLGIVYCF